MLTDDQAISGRVSGIYMHAAEYATSLAKSVNKRNCRWERR